MKELELKSQILAARAEVSVAETKVRIRSPRDYIEKYDVYKRKGLNKRVSEAVAIVLYTGNPMAALLYLKDIGRDLSNCFFPEKLLKEKIKDAKQMAVDTDILSNRREQSRLCASAEVAYKGFFDESLLIAKYTN